MSGEQASPDTEGVLALPRIPARAIQRPRLLERLDTAWDLAIVHGPGGSGKSVLLSQWAHELEQNRARGSPTEDSPETTGESAAVPLRWVDAGVGSQFQEMVDHLSEQSGIVIVDRADALSQPTLAALGQSLDANRHGVRLVLATRSARVVDALVESSDGTPLCIDAAALYITEEELADAAPSLNRQRRRALISEVGGLIAGIRDALEGSGNRAVSRFRARLFSDVAQRPSDYAQALSRLAVVHELDAQVARAIGLDASWIPLAEEDGLGHRDGSWFVVSRFAAAVLMPVAERTPMEERLAWSRAALGAGLIEDRPVEALRLAVELGDLDLASYVVLIHATAYLSDVRAVNAASSIIPTTGLSRYPILMLVLAHSQAVDPSTRANGMQFFAQSVVAMRSRCKVAPPEEVIFWRAVIAVVLRLTPMADRALPEAKKSMQALAEIGWLSHDSRYAEALGYQLGRVGLTAFFSGDFDCAEEMFERSNSELQVAGYEERMDSLALGAATRALRGDLHGARSLIDRADELDWPQGWRDGLQGQAFHLAKALLVVESGADLDRAFWDHLLACGPVEDHLEHWVTYAVVLAWRDALYGEPIGGLARIRAIRSHRARMPTTSVARSWLDAAESLLTAMTGDMPAARALAEAAARHSADGAVALARIHLATGHETEALTALAAMDQLPRATVRMRAEAEVISTVIALRAGQPEGALMFERVVSRIRPTGMLLPFVGLSDADRFLLADCARAAKQGDIARLIERARPARPLKTLRIPRLTKRELAVLHALHESPSLTTVAEKLYVSRNTVKSQVRTLYRKLDVGTREEAISRSIVLGLTTRERDIEPIA